MKKIISMALLSVFAGCQPKQEALKHEVLKYEEYDIPAKSQIDTRILLKEPATKKNVESLLDAFFHEQAEKSMKYRSRPSHIFIYVYDDSLAYERDGSSWLGMVSRMNNKDEEKQFKNGLK